MKKNYLKIMLVCMLGVFLSNCEDGEIGPDGKDGINGADGTNGSNGTDGTNGQGFDELVKYGDIELTIAGKRPDEVEFNITQSFKYAPAIGDNNGFVVNENYIYLSSTRFLSAPGASPQNTKANLSLEIKDQGTENEALDYFSMDIRNFYIVAEDLSSFEINTRMNTPIPFVDDQSDVTNFNLSNYAFNKETNELTATASFTIPAIRNSTENDLSITIKVNVISLEYIGIEKR